jgi:hypothetical protein
MRLEASLHHDVDKAGREQRVAITITAVADHAGASSDPVERLGVHRQGEQVRMRRGQDRLGQPGAAARLEPALLPIERAQESAAPGAPEPLAGEGLIHEPEHRPVALDQPDQRPP